MSEFIDQFSLLKTVEITLLRTNNEVDNNGFFQQAREVKDAANAENMRIIHHNGKEGLIGRMIKNQLESALRQGNSKAKLKGRDLKGNRLEGNNEDFKVRASLSEVPSGIPDIALRCYRYFQDLVAERVISVGTPKEDILSKIRKIWEKENHNP
jgi:hypothetical protein